MAITDRAIVLLQMLTPSFLKDKIRMVDKFELYVPMQSSPGGRVYVVSVYVQNRSMNKCVDVPATHRSLPAVEYART